VNRVMSWSLWDSGIKDTNPLIFLFVGPTVS